MKCVTAFPERAYRLSQITQKMTPSHDYPLLKACALKPKSAKKLKNSVINYLHTTLNEFYPDADIQLSQNLLDEQIDRLAGLPNITPNGIILPKFGTLEAYNLVHAEVVNIFEDAGLPDHAETIFAPISIRLVRGIPAPNIDSRPRATTKYHLDIWSGEPADAISVFLPVLGDTKNVGIRWIEPAVMPNCFRRTLDDFSHGESLVRGGSEYNFCFQNGDLLLFDSYLLHATQKQQATSRVSLDFRFISRKKSPGDHDVPGVRRDTYLTYNIWSDIGRGSGLRTMTPLEKYTNGDDRPTNSYPGKYEIVQKK